PYFDIRNARYLLSFGSDFLGPWISQVRHNVDYGVFRQGDYRSGSNFRPRPRSTPRGYLVQVDSRFSATAANADEWIWVPPGTEGLVALGVANVLAGQNASAAPAGSFGAYTPDRVASDIKNAAGNTPSVTADKIRELAGNFGSKRPGLAIG